MFTPASDTDYREPFPGIRFKPLVHGAKTLCTEFRLRKDCILPRHSHPNEQAGYLVSGAMRVTIGSETFEARPGDSWCIPGGVEHEGVVLADAVVVEMFSPVRETFERDMDPQPGEVSNQENSAWR